MSGALAQFVLVLKSKIYAQQAAALPNGKAAVHQAQKGKGPAPAVAAEESDEESEEESEEEEDSSEASSSEEETSEDESEDSVCSLPHLAFCD